MKKCKITKVGTIIISEDGIRISLEGWGFDGSVAPDTPGAVLSFKYPGFTNGLFCGYTFEDLYIISKVVEWRKEEEQRDICQTRLP